MMNLFSIDDWSARRGAVALMVCLAGLPGSVAGADAATLQGDPFAARDSLGEAYDCLIEPMVVTELGSPARGIVARVLVERGESVTRGQPLVELESSVERAGLEEAQARADMSSETQARETELSFADLDLVRFEDMHARQLAPEQQRDEALARRQLASAALVQALENRRLAQLELQRIRHELERRTISSPIDGVVVDTLVSVGELVLDEPVARVAQLDPLRVEAVLPGRLFGTVHQGGGAQLFREYGQEAAQPATVDLVDPMLDARSGTFRVRLTLANPGLAIVAGQQCRVSFEEPDASAALPGAVDRSGL